MIIDTINPPSEPDSSFDSDLTKAKQYQTSAGVISIAPGDWVDVIEECGVIDPIWGQSVQVMDTMYDDLLCILGFNINTGLYYKTCLSAEYVTNNYRRVSNEGQ